PAETAEVKEPGTYTITVTAGDDYKFADEAVTTFTFEVTAAVAYVAQVGETQYTTIGEAIEAAEVGGVVMLLEDIDTAVIGKRVEFQGEKTIANATVSAAALPLDLTHVTFTNTTFAADVTANTTVFEHQWEGKFGTLTNAGMTVAEGGFYTYSEYEATIGANRYATLPEAVAASVAGDTVVLCKDIALSAALIIKKSITIATGADHDLTIDASAVATAFAVQANPDAASDIIVKFIGSADSRLIIDAKGASNSKSTVLSQRCDTEFEYVTIKNSNSSYKGGGLYVTTGKAKLTNCVLDSNKTSSSDGGGALYMTASGVVEMTRCTLSNNENTAGPGGAVQSASNSSFTATNCSFENNKASGKGGVIRLNGAMQLTGCTFAGNSSSDADISEANSADVVRSIAGSTFDKTEAEAIARNASGHIVLSTENPNTFVIDVVEIAVPTAKNAAYTSLDIAFEQLFEGYDAEKMTCAGPATVKEIGSYTYTFTAKEGFAFPGNQTTAEVVAKVTAPDDGTASGGTGEVDITMGAKVGDTITAAFYVDIKDTVPADKYDSVIMRVQLGDGSTVDLTGTENADGQLEYDFENIFSQHMTEKLSGSVIGIKSEVETVLGDFEGISIAEYCDKLAAAYPDNEKLLGFLANMLRYGAECQKYAEFRVDNLADAGHAWMDGKVQTADPVATVAKDEISRFAEGADKANGSIKGAGLNIMNKIAIYFLVSLPESADASAAVLTVNGTDYALSAKSGDDYVVVADRINPSEYGKVFKAELKLDGTAVAHTVNYSVNTYCADMFGGDGTAIQNLVKAIYNYGVAAAAYAE
ncbi:MAG: right-handed parallel beta-helix repeat-containing protein, partial [Lachnospiraceae bacterium]|nr:right-handed parallel beta-helix repeat-containing protein [Lachnospiraceae bacterium]